jgi:hypothetical protein
MIRRVLAVLAASIVVSGATATAALAEYPPTSGAGSVSATTLQAGDDVTFSGGGFKLGSKVTISVDDAVDSTVVAGITTASFDRSAQVHIGNAAFVRNAAATPASGAFSTTVVLQTAGVHVLSAAGVAPTGAPRVVTAKVTVMKDPGTPVTASGSGLPFTGSSVVVPGLVVGLAMVGGGFLLLTTVRSRRAGQARS